MKSVNKLTLERSDIKDAIKYWIENYHGLDVDLSDNDRINIRPATAPIIVTLIEELT
jgi:hypothetical protein